MLMMRVELDIYYRSHFEIYQIISIANNYLLSRNIYFGLSVEDSFDCRINCMRIR